MATFNLMQEEHDPVRPRTVLCSLGDSRCLRLNFLEAETETGIYDLKRECFSKTSVREETEAVRQERGRN